MCQKIIAACLTLKLFVKYYQLGLLRKQLLLSKQYPESDIWNKLNCVLPEVHYAYSSLIRQPHLSYCETEHQARNQLGTPEGEKSFLRGPNLLNYVQ